jgi:hypothetical protein
MIEDEVIKKALIIEQMDGVIGIVSKTRMKQMVVIDKIGMFGKRTFIVKYLTVLTVFINMLMDGDIGVLKGVVEVIVITINLVVKDCRIPGRW